MGESGPFWIEPALALQEWLLFRTVEGTELSRFCGLVTKLRLAVPGPSRANDSHLRQPGPHLIALFGNWSARMRLRSWQEWVGSGHLG